jgi:hypothetical protein
MNGKGSKRRKEDFKALQNNWDNISWGKPCKTCDGKKRVLVTFVHSGVSFTRDCPDCQK